jgi:hypothetical protein
VAFKVNYDLNNTVNGVLPYTTANTEIPPQVLDYFRSQPGQGRILGVNVPFWIYLLPMYVNKPIIDGWYPQTKLVNPLVEINDYRFDDLETAPTPAFRFGEWRSLIAQSQLLEISWVIVGDNGTLAGALMAGTNFTEQLTVPYGGVQLIIFKSLEPPSLVDGEVHVTNISRPNPDQIKISIDSIQAPTAILVKEAYFPTWRATSNGAPLGVDKDASTGYILLIAPAGTHEVTLYQNATNTLWNGVSAAALILIVAFAVATQLHRKRKRG